MITSALKRKQSRPDLDVRVQGYKMSKWVAGFVGGMFILLVTPVRGVYPPTAMAAESNGPLRPTQPRAGVSGVVKGKPFHAKFEVTGSRCSANDTWVKEIFRDRVGSVRTDLCDSRFSWILEVRSQRLVILDHSTRTAHATPVNLATDGSSFHWGFNKVPTFAKDSQEILGINCRKVLLSNDKLLSSDAGEVWIADELAVALRDVKPEGGGLVIWKATWIELGDPDPSAFEIPRGYETLGLTGE